MWGRVETLAVAFLSPTTIIHRSYPFPTRFHKSGAKRLIALTSNTPDQLFHRIGVLPAKINPCHTFEKDWQYWNFSNIWQQDGNNRATSIHKLTEEGVQFLFLPGSHIIPAHKHCCRFNLANLLLKQRLPGSPRRQLPFIQPG